MDDLMGEQVRGYKVAKSVYPQLKTFSGSSTVGVKTGSQIVNQATLVYDTEVAFDPTTSYKCDFKKGGRYLTIRYSKSDQKDFELTGHDIDVITTGRR